MTIFTIIVSIFVTYKKFVVGLAFKLLHKVNTINNHYMKKLGVKTLKQLCRTKCKHSCIKSKNYISKTTMKIK